MTSQEAFRHKPLSSSPSNQTSLKFKIATKLFVWFIWLMTPFKLAIFIQLKDAKDVQGNNTEILRYARMNLTTDKVKLLQDTEGIMAQLSSEEKEYLKDKQNDFKIQNSLRTQKAIIARLRGIPTGNKFYESIVDGDMFYFFLNYFRRVEGDENASDKAKFIVGIIQKSLIDNTDYIFTHKNDDTDSSEDDFLNKSFRPLTIMDSLQAKQIYLDWYCLRNFEFKNESPVS